MLNLNHSTFNDSFGVFGPIYLNKYYSTKEKKTSFFKRKANLEKVENFLERMSESLKSEVGTFVKKHFLFMREFPRNLKEDLNWRFSCFKFNKFLLRIGLFIVLI